jgi:hypothetical protein
MEKVKDITTRKEVKLLMDEERKLYIRDDKGIEYNFWELGWELPISLIIETYKERIAEKEQSIRRQKERQEKEQLPWYKKIFNN